MNHEDIREQYNEAFKFLVAGDHEVIIFGVLRRLHIGPNHEYYDDMVQEGRLAFVNAYPQAPTDSEKKRLVYIYQKVYWTMLDYLRKQTTLNNHKYVPDETTPEQDELFDIPAEHRFETEYDTHAVFAQLMDKCTESEKRFLLAAYKYGMNNAEIAREYRVSKPAVAKWRNGVHRKAKEIEF